MQYYVAWEILTVAIGCSLVSLIALWAAVSRARKIVRFAVIAALVALLLPIAAIGLAHYVLLQVAGVVGLVWIARLLRAYRTSKMHRRETDSTYGDTAILRFSLRAAFLMLLFAACFFATLRLIAETTFSGYFSEATLSLSSAAVAVATAWAVLGPGRVAARLLVLVAVLAVCSVGVQWQRPSAINWFGFSTLRAIWPWIWRIENLIGLILMCAQAALVSVWLLTLKGAGFLGHDRLFGAHHTRTTPLTPSRSSLALRAFRLLVPIVAVVTISPLAIVYAMMLRAGPVPEAQIPNPNSFEPIAALAGEFQFGNWSRVTATVPQLKGFVQTNKDELARVHAALSSDFWVPIDQFDDIGRGPEYLFRDVGRALDIEGRLAEREGRFRDAAEIYFDELRLGRYGVQGATPTFAMMARRGELNALEGLARIRRKLSRDEMGQLVDALGSIKPRLESPAVIMQRDRALVLAQFDREGAGWWGRRHLAVNRLSGVDAWIHEILDRDQKEGDALLALLRCELSIQMHLLDTGRFPARLDELTPVYLDSIPRDPFGSGRIAYNLKPDGYALYSVGPNGRDDRGARLKRASDWSAAGADVSLSAYGRDDY